MGFTTPSYPLSDLFARADRGELQLPDFQREYVWDLDRIRTLLTSVLRGYPVGSLLALDTRNVALRFKVRPVSGAPDTGREPGLVLLDGQQRLTSLYRALTGDGVVATRDFLGHSIERRFFIDVEAAVGDPMPVEALFVVDTEGSVRSHFGPRIDGAITTWEDMVTHGVVPVSWLLGPQARDLLFDMAAAAQTQARRDAVRSLHNTVLSALPAYTVPVVRVDRDTSLTGVGQIFAHANSVGDVFELLSAVFALHRPGFVLEERYVDVAKRLKAHPALAGIGKIEFLRALSLLVTSRRGTALVHRGDIVNLNVEDFEAHAGDLAGAFERAADFLAQRCVFSPGQVPYPAQIVSLAAVLARLDDLRDAHVEGEMDEELDEELDQQATDRLNQWFWCGMFGELYGGEAPTIRSGSDVEEVTPWVLGHTETVPSSVADAQFHQSRLLTADPDSGVYRGLFSLLMARGARDWRTGLAFTGETFLQLETEFATVFPRPFCDAHGVDPTLAESVLNRTPLGLRTKVLMEGNGPKRYLPRLQSKSLLEDAEFDEMVAGHQIAPAALAASAHQEFFRDRLARFTDIIEYSMGKPAHRDLPQL